MSEKINDESDWDELQCCLRNQLKPYGFNRHCILTMYQPYKKRLFELVKRTALMSESNSVLIIGPRGSGKSQLLESVTKDLYSDPSIKGSMIHVKLNGLIHTDDNIALNAIMQQLCLEGLGEKTIGSFAEKLTILLDALRSGTKQSKCILFVLDEFDLFCSHKEQTLLYNLFDVAQSQQSPICVVGLSCRPDILSKLENRVRSRFSHQQIYLFEQIKLSDFVPFAKRVLFLPSEFRNSSLKDIWNSNVDEVINQQAVQDILKTCLQYNNNIRDLKRYLYYVVITTGNSNKMLESGHFIDAFTLYSRDSKRTLIQGLSILEVSLVIAMMHLSELLEGELFNLEMVYHEYKKFLQKKMSMKDLDKDVVMKALEHLLDVELVKEVIESRSGTLKRFAPMRLMIEPSQVKEAVGRYPNLPVQLQQWSQSWIVE